MKKLLLTGVTALFLATGAAHADDPKQTRFGEIYLSGLAAGLVAAVGATAALPKGQQLFCPPEKLNITGAMLDDMMRNFAREHPKLKGRSDINIVIGAILALQDTFPCKPQ